MVGKLVDLVREMKRPGIQNASEGDSSRGVVSGKLCAADVTDKLLE